VKTINMIVAFFTALIVAGCSPSGMIYDIAADERSVTAMASDSVITSTIQKSILEADDMKILDISVYSYNGQVYLVGEYDKTAQKEKAAKIAKSTSGVKHVEVRLFPKKQIDACGTKENLLIKGELKAMLLADTDIWTPIDTEVVQCTIILLGIVESKEELARAVAVAKSVKGNRGVISYLKVTQ
jgi:hyperosmotically inducible periplasmic protein